MNSLDSSKSSNNIEKLYFKITNKKENHHGFQYYDGLNELKEEFNDDPDASCVAGGFYFTDVENIFKFLDFGIYLREITLPINDSDFRIVKDKSDKWRTNKIILGQKRNLSDVSTFQYLIDRGADINDYIYAVKYASKNGHLDIVKLLTTTTRNISIRTDYDSAIISASEYGHIDIVKFLTDNCANIRAHNDLALVRASQNGHLDIVKFLIEKGANIHTYIDSAIKHASARGNLEVVKILIEPGADVHASNDYSLGYASANGHLNIVKILVEKGANIHADNDFAIKWASINGHLEVVQFLTLINENKKVK